ncbi:MAG: orotate phosphoribosyltransferase [Spirochaetia bacterium]|jgi:orotate phosphoribosyltransferase|nr:orotate phosphoribosyltransferase [Spirochaetia bacterium]
MNSSDIRENYGRKLAALAFELGAIKLRPDDPFTWASGYRMPIYNDNRRLLSRPEARKLVCQAFQAMLEEVGFKPQNIAGTSTAGIPHATTLADALALPLSYVRSSSKNHGMQQQIEGLLDSHSYGGASVLLIEDLISTGGSSIKAVQAIVAAGGVCPYTFAIFTYGLDASAKAFDDLDPSCTALSILDYDLMVQCALEKEYIRDKGAELLVQWKGDPFGWGEKNGFMPQK